ncbi:MAG: MlaD family protein [Bryobacteraceae bacterium]|jgi:phospholipid/cholesterol/gamma-HCH transport system substrate-binding protein
MPAAKKVRWAQLRVGVMAIVAMTILAVLIWLFTGQTSLWERYANIYSYMRDSAALADGAPVRLNGILVGSVKGVELTRSTDPNRVVRVVMKVNSNRLSEIPVDSIAGIAAENVLGTKYINIAKGRKPQTVQPEGELPSEASAEIEDLVKKGFGLFDSVQAILNRLDKIVSQVESGQGTIGKFLIDDEFYNRLVATVAEFQKVTVAISSGKGTVGKLLYDEGLYNDARASLQRLDAVIQELQQGQGTAGKLLKDPALYDETRASIAEFRKILDDLNAGKGTAGKLLKDETVHKQIESVLSKLDTTLDRLNSGQGTMGQLMVNPQLYDSIKGMTEELHSLLADIHKNPKKFLRIKMGLF